MVIISGVPIFRTFTVLAKVSKTFNHKLLSTKTVSKYHSIKIMYPKCILHDMSFFEITFYLHFAGGAPAVVMMTSLPVTRHTSYSWTASCLSEMEVFYHNKTCPHAPDMCG